VPDRIEIARWLAWVAAATLLVLLVLPIAALVRRAVTEWDGLTDSSREVMREALILSAYTSAISLGLVILLGTPLAYLLARKQIPGKAIIETLVDLPLVLPPAVAGLALLMAFGRRGLVGSTLEGWGITIGFTTTAVVLAQVFVSSPFYVRTARAGFDRVDQELEDAAAVLGADPWMRMRAITLPMVRSSLGAGAVLAWARSVAEFGATIIFAGSILGETQTMPLAIYGRFEAGDLETALLLGVVLLFVSMLVLLSVRVGGGRNGAMARW